MHSGPISSVSLLTQGQDCPVVFCGGDRHHTPRNPSPQFPYPVSNFPCLSNLLLGHPAFPHLSSDIIIKVTIPHLCGSARAMMNWQCLVSPGSDALSPGVQAPGLCRQQVCCSYWFGREVPDWVFAYELVTAL